MFMILMNILVNCVKEIICSLKKCLIHSGKNTWVDNERNNNAKSKIKNCLHYRANYEEVLQQMMNQVAEAMSATNPL